MGLAPSIVSFGELRPQYSSFKWASPPSIFRRASSSAINSWCFTPPMFYHLGGARPLVSIFDPWRFVSWRLQLLIVAVHFVSCPIPCLISWKENVSFMYACMHVCMYAYMHVCKWFMVSCQLFSLLESWRFPVGASSCPSSMLSLRVLQLSSVLSNSFPNSIM